MPERLRGARDGQGRRRTVHRTLPVTAETAHQAVSDVVATAGHSGEIAQLWWERRVDPGTVTVGDRFAYLRVAGRRLLERRIREITPPLPRSS